MTSFLPVSGDIFRDESIEAADAPDRKAGCGIFARKHGGYLCPVMLMDTLLGVIKDVASSANEVNIKVTDGSSQQTRMLNSIAASAAILLASYCLRATAPS